MSLARLTLRPLALLCLGLLISSLLVTTAADQKRSSVVAIDLDEGPYVIRVYYEQVERIRELAEYDLWEVRNKVEGYVLVRVTPAEHLEIDQKWRTELDIEFSQEVRRAERAPQEQAEGGGGIPSFPCYRTVEETYLTAQQLVAANPTLASWSDIGDSWEKLTGIGGYDIMVLKLTNSAIVGDKPKLVITTSTHPREYVPVELSTRFAEYLLGGYGSNADATWLLDDHEVHLILFVNPDGRKQAENGSMWRKNTSTDYCGVTSPLRGVDLNRNFEFEWGCCGGSSASECSETYRGMSPASEPETQAVQSYLRSVFPDQRGPSISDAAPIDATGIYLDNHAFGELVLWSWGFTNSVAPNGVELQTLGRKLASFNGYEPQQGIELYPTDGTTDDFGYGDLGVASYTYEVGTNFFQDCSSFENKILPDNLESLIYAAKAARAPYQLPAGPDAVAVNGSPAFVQPGESLTLVATIDDTRFSNSNGVEPTQTIAAAEAYAAIPPWHPMAPAPLPMSAADGLFDSAVEAVELSVETTGLSGRQLYFVRGQDSEGNWGAVSATYVYVADGSEAMLSGAVTEQLMGKPLVATVAVDALGLSMSTDAAGRFVFELPVGSWSLRVSAPGYVEQTIEGLVIVAQTDLVQNASLALIPDLLLVDDDDNSPDVRDRYTDALDAMGLDYLVWDTNNSDDEPSAQVLESFSRVIWMTGDEYGGASGPGVAGEAALSSWLDASGCLMVASQEYYYDRGLTAFSQGYLGLQSANSDVAQSLAVGAGVYNGLGPYLLSYPYTNYSDDLVPDASAEIAFTGSAGTAAAISKQTSLYWTTFTSVGLEAMSSIASRIDVLQRFFDQCDVVSQLDGDADGVANVEDCAAGESSTWALPGPAQQLQLTEGASTQLDWVAPTNPGASVYSYDLLRSTTAQNFVGSSCVDSGTTLTTAVESAVPQTGEFFFYLVRVQNGCGASLGVQSSGLDRSAESCN
jgi:murein tripeptide amidase MpaA